MLLLATTVTHPTKVLSTIKNVHDKEYQKEFDNYEKGDEDLATNKTQGDHFRNPIQQHHLLFTSSKARSVVKFKRNFLLGGNQ